MFFYRLKEELHFQEQKLKESWTELEIKRKRLVTMHNTDSHFMYIRGGGTGPADPASAGPIILAQLNAHAKPYLPLV